MSRFPWLRSQPTDPLQGLPPRFTLEELFAVTETRRGRPLQVKDCSLPPEFFALWVATPAKDWIVCAIGMRGLQRSQAIAHEVAHILLGHRPRVATSHQGIREALHDSSKMHALARTGNFDTAQEVAAEELAGQICLRLCAENGNECAEDSNWARFVKFLG